MTTPFTAYGNQQPQQRRSGYNPLMATMGGLGNSQTTAPGQHISNGMFGNAQGRPPYQNSDPMNASINHNFQHNGFGNMHNTGQPTHPANNFAQADPRSQMPHPNHGMNYGRASDRNIPYSYDQLPNNNDGRMGNSNSMHMLPRYSSNEEGYDVRAVQDPLRGSQASNPLLARLGQSNGQFGQKAMRNSFNEGMGYTGPRNTNPRSFGNIPKPTTPSNGRNGLNLNLNNGMPYGGTHDNLDNSMINPRNVTFKPTEPVTPNYYPPDMYGNQNNSLAGSSIKTRPDKIDLMNESRGKVGYSPKPYREQGEMYNQNLISSQLTWDENNNRKRGPVKPILKPPNTPRRNNKKARFNQDVLVHEVESWKIYNVDMGKEAKARFRKESQQECTLI